MSDNIGRQGLHGAALNIASSILTMALHLIAVLVLSRILEPDDFGLIAMVQAVIAFGEVIRDTGLSNAALQQRNLSNQLASNLFWINVAVASSIFFLILLATPLVVSIYDEPRLWPIVPALAASVLFHGIGAQIRVQLARSFRFGALATSSVIAQLVSVSIAIGLAVWGWGYWALVAQTLSSAIVLLVIQWAISRWRPQRVRKGHGTLQLVRIGLDYLLNQFISFLQANGTTIVIGRVFGAAMLGSYNRAYQLASLPVGGTLGPLMRIVVPTLNEYGKIGQSTGRFVLRIEVLIGAIFMGAMASVAGASRGAIPLLLGPGWDEAVGIFRILAIAVAVDALYYVCFWVFMHHGLSRQLLYFNCLARPFTLMTVIVGSHFGLRGAALGYLVGCCLAWPAHFIWLRKLPGFPSVGMLFRGSLIVVYGLIVVAFGDFVWVSVAELGDFYSSMISILSGLALFTALMMLSRVTRVEIVWLFRRANAVLRGR